MAHLENSTDSEASEHTIQHMAGFQQTVLDSANVSIISTDLNGVIQTFNKAAQNWLGYAVEEVIGKQSLIAIHDVDEISDHAEVLTIELGAKVEPGVDALIAKARFGTADENEWTYIRKNGTRFSVQVSITAVHDDKGEILGYLAIGNDITARKEAEQALKELILRYQSLFEYAEDSIFLSRPGDFHFIDVNHNAAKRLGYTREELLQMNTWDINPPEDGPLLAELGKKLLSDGNARFEKYHRRKDGTLMPVEISSRVIYYGDQQVVQSFVRDITERKAAEEALRQVEERIHLMIDEVVDYAIFTLDTEGYIMTWNAGAQRIKGYTADEIIGQHFSRFYSAEEVADGKPQRELVIAGSQGRFEEEGWRFRKDGSRFWANVIITALRDSDGQLRGFSKVTRDITERKLAEQKLQESEARYRSVVESMAEGIVVQDADGVIQTCNSSAERILGLSAAQMQGVDALDPRWQGIHENGTPFIAEERPTVFTRRTGKGRNNVVMGIHKPDGSLTWVSISTQPLFYAGETKPDGIVASFVDITEHKRIEQELAKARDEALESARIKSTFLATMSHEIRTPMNGVLGMVDLLLATNLDEKQRKMLEVIQSSGRTLLNIINDTLDFSKIEAGGVGLEQQDFEPVQVIEGMVGLLASQAQIKGLSLMALVDPEVPSVLNGDSMRLQQILVNLVGNAIKFTEHGEVLVHAMLENMTQTHATLQVSISDTGIGLSVEARENLFQPFSQADDSTTRRYGGTGLGLAICKGLVELMGGEIGVESETGQGATFRLRIPFTIPSAATRTQLGAQPEGDLHNTKVLLVDDSTSARLILGRYLSKLKARTGTASSGKRALEELRAAATANEPYDAAVIDLVMPGLDGISLAQAIKQDPVVADTALILITAFYTEESQKQALQAGFVATLPKPVRQAQLFKAIKERYNPQLTLIAAEQPAPVITGEFEAKQRILLVEDNPVNQLVASMQLERLGYKVEIAENGVEVLQIIDKEPYDLILMDCHMPEMDGFEATRRIRRREADGQTHVPIIAMTANAMQGDREVCLKAGMDDYIAKPIALSDLKQALERWLEPAEVVKHEIIPVSLPAEALPPVTLDTDVLDNLCKLSKRSKPVVLRKLVDNFLTNSPKLLAEMRSAVENEQVSTLQRVAHTLKSSSASYGALYLADLCRILEASARAGDAPIGIQQVEQIEAEYDNVKRALELQLEGES